MWPRPHLVLDPGHQVVDVARRGALYGDLHHVAVCPVVLVVENIMQLKNISTLSPPTSYLAPADMTGQVLSVQQSASVPTSIVIWLTKSTTLYATHLS